MRVLLTGHKGYLGTVMAPVLTAAGHEVTGLDSGLYADCVLGPAPDDPPGLAIDLRDVTADQLVGFDAVVHLAALPVDPLSSLAPKITHAVNHHASSRLARLAKDAGVRRFVYASTCSVYGAQGSDALLNEDAPLRPVTPYAESKVRVEEDVLELADADFSPTSMRNATAFGFSPRLRADIALNNLVGNALLTGAVKVVSDGSPWRSLVHARDIADAAVEILAAPTEAVHARAFNIGIEENNRTVAEIASAVVDAVPGSELLITGESGADPRSCRVDFSRFRAVAPGFTARWTIPAGARELFAAYRTHGLTQQAFDRRFTRLAALSDRSARGELDASLRPSVPEVRLVSGRGGDSVQPDTSPHAVAVPRVSIGLPVYNGQNFLAESLDALLGQSYTDFELIISDNTSTDDTEAICRRYMALDSRIRYIRQPRNIGLANNHNAVIREARGEYFKWASHDDLYGRDLLKRCVEALDEHPAAVLSHAHQAIVDEQGVVVNGYDYQLATSAPSPSERFRSLLWVDGGDDQYGLMRTEMLRRVRPYNSYHNAGRPLMAEIAMHGPFVHIPELLYFRRDHPARGDRNPTIRAICNNMDPRRAEHSTARLVVEYLLAYFSLIARAPIPVAERARCLRHLIGWMLRRALRKSPAQESPFTPPETVAVRTAAEIVAPAPWRTTA